MQDEIDDMELDFTIISDKIEGLTETIPLMFPNARHNAQNIYGEARDNLAGKYV